ncbi:MAG: hypothetical protein ACT6Q3_06435 [Sphingopyxis sp.]
MNFVSRTIRWIDSRYDDGISRSNLAMGLILSIILLAALNVESPNLRLSLEILAVVVALIFAWRMAAWIRRLAKKTDERNRTHR